MDYRSDLEMIEEEYSFKNWLKGPDFEYDNLESVLLKFHKKKPLLGGYALFMKDAMESGVFYFFNSEVSF